MIDFVDFRDERTKNISNFYGIDAIILTLPENIFYFSGFFPLGMNILHSTVSFLVVNPYNKRMCLVTSVADVPTILEIGFKQPIYPVGNFSFHIPRDDEFSKLVSERLTKRYATYNEALAAALIDVSSSPKRVAIDEARMPMSNIAYLKNQYNEIEFISGTQIINEIRCIKHPQEVEHLRVAANIAEDAIYDALGDIAYGMSEHDIVKSYRNNVINNGCDPYFCVVTIDERSAFSDTVPRKWSKLKAGSVIRLDFGCIYKNYRSDLARTVIIGQNKKAEAYYNAILEGENRAIDAIKPGIPASEIFQIAVNTTRDAGISHYNRNHVGHGIGIATYDMPSLNPTNNDLLEENMVLCVETPYYEIGWGGVQVEDTVLVTSDGVEFLSRSPNELIRIEV